MNGIDRNIIFIYLSSLILWGNSNQHSIVFFLLTPKNMKCWSTGKPCRLSSHSSYKNWLHIREIQLTYSKSHISLMINLRLESNSTSHCDFWDYRWIHSWPPIHKQNAPIWNQSKVQTAWRKNGTLPSRAKPFPWVAAQWLKDMKGIWLLPPQCRVHPWWPQTLPALLWSHP